MEKMLEFSSVVSHALSPYLNSYDNKRTQTVNHHIGITEHAGAGAVPKQYSLEFLTHCDQIFNIKNSVHKITFAIYANTHTTHYLS